MKPPRWWALAVLLAAGAGRAQVPAADEMAAAFRAAEAQARLALQPGALWWAAWRERSPLVAGYSRGVCQLGFAPYIPGRDYRWLFPALPAAQRAAWLAGLVQHELAHCAEQAAAQAAVQADRQTNALAAHDVGPAGLMAGPAGQPMRWWPAAAAPVGMRCWAIWRLRCMSTSQAPSRVRNWWR